jgi:hypothetical protein
LIDGPANEMYIYPLRALKQASGQYENWSIAFGLDSFFLESSRYGGRPATSTKGSALIL